ncbi:MAG: hypothetical protein EOP48_14235 [Sphingobacteriales bacterium]|nr:MAG: hypothetical protein EOP48_14235 [Sphingobacteriales bacterium]
MKRVTIYATDVKIIREDRSAFTFFFTRDSGKVYCGSKLSSCPDLKCAVIYLGKDSRGQEFFLQNSYRYHRAVLVTEIEFRRNMSIWLYKTVAMNPPLQAIKNALWNAMVRAPYNVVLCDKRWRSLLRVM